MLRSILAIFRARYALTALFLFGAVQAYSLARLVSDRLPPLPVFSLLWGDGRSGSDSPSANRPADMGPIAAAITKTHPLQRMFYWVVGYGLLCLAGVPLIKWALARESNVSNGVLILGYSCMGGLMAFALMAFRFTWLTGIVGVLAFVCAAFGIIRLAGMLEQFRVEDMVGSR
jgi:hypothetical protein